MSRPRKIVDEKRVIALASKGLTQQEIAAFENISVDTLTRHYAESWEKGRRLASGSIRRKQFDLAMNGNPVMCIWLGKQLCDQKDKQDIDVHRQVTVRMVVGIEQNELNTLTNGYFAPATEKQLPQSGPMLEASPERSFEVSVNTQKDEVL